MFFSCLNSQGHYSRRIPLHTELKKILLNTKKSDEYVSPYRKASYACKAIKRLSHTDLPQHINPYNFRKTFGTWLAQKNVPTYKLAKLMGHKNIQTTLKYYIGLDHGDLKSSIENI